MTPPQILTLGVYGHSETEFFTSLQRARVDLFCDIRRRRGVRGSKYAFVNSQRLQAELHELGIAYQHIKELAPDETIRQAQKNADKLGKIVKRQRNELAPSFIAAYEDSILADFSPQVFLADLPNEFKVIAFFCVERTPEACHRSLVAKRFAQLGLEVRHI